MQDLRAEGVRFPGRDAESLAPIFTPAQSAPITTPAAPAPVHDGAPTEAPADVAARSVQVFEVARNARELLDTMLTSSPAGEALQDEVTVALVAQVRASQRDVQALVQAAGDANEAVLFEALNVNDDLQRSLDKVSPAAAAGVQHRHAGGQDRRCPNWYLLLVSHPCSGVEPETRPSEFIKSMEQTEGPAGELRQDVGMSQGQAALLRTSSVRIGGSQPRRLRLIRVPPACLCSTTRWPAPQCRPPPLPQRPRRQPAQGQGRRGRAQAAGRARRRRRCTRTCWGRTRRTTRRGWCARATRTRTRGRRRSR